MFLALSEVKGHLEILEEEGSIKAYIAGGKRLYSICDNSD